MIQTSQSHYEIENFEPVELSVQVSACVGATGRLQITWEYLESCNVSSCPSYPLNGKLKDLDVRPTTVRLDAFSFDPGSMHQFKAVAAYEAQWAPFRRKPKPLNPKPGKQRSAI